MHRDRRPRRRPCTVHYLDVPYEHRHENQPAGDGDDVEHDLQPLRRALQIPKGAERRRQKQAVKQTHTISSQARYRIDPTINEAMICDLRVISPQKMGSRTLSTLLGLATSMTVHW
jgi:hypothetical protein